MSLKKFSPDEFKKWVKEHQEQFEPKLSKKSIIIGTMVESTVNVKKLLENVDIREGESKAVIRDFLHYGGTVAGCHAEASPRSDQ